MRMTAIALGALGLTMLPAGASESELVGDITGVWKGTGFVQRNETSEPINVRCQIDGMQTELMMGFEGECRAMLVVKRPIGARLAREGDRFTGTYTGSRVGVAELDGALDGDSRIVLDMTFPKEVNGDDKAVMTINNADDGTFTITTVDKMVSGVDVTTSQITFERE